MSGLFASIMIKYAGKFAWLLGVFGFASETIVVLFSNVAANFPLVKAQAAATAITIFPII